MIFVKHSWVRPVHSSSVRAMIMKNSRSFSYNSPSSTCGRHKGHVTRGIQGPSHGEVFGRRQGGVHGLSRGWSRGSVLAKPGQCPGVEPGWDPGAKPLQGFRGQGQGQGQGQGVVEVLSQGGVEGQANAGSRGLVRVMSKDGSRAGIQGAEPGRGRSLVFTEMGNTWDLSSGIMQRINVHLVA